MARPVEINLIPFFKGVPAECSPYLCALAGCIADGFANGKSCWANSIPVMIDTQVAVIETGYDISTFV